MTHLAKVWPEQRARIQVLADRAEAYGSPTVEPTPTEGTQDDRIVIDREARGLGVMICRKDAFYRGRRMTVRHHGFRFLVALAMGHPPPSVPGRALADVREALRGCGAGEVEIRQAAGQYQLVGTISPTERVLKAVGIRRRGLQ